MQHETDIKYKGGLRDLAQDLGNLRYDKLEEFLHVFAEKIEHDAASDGGRGRAMLAESLKETAASLRMANFHMAEAWRISKPHMKEDGSC